MHVDRCPSDSESQNCGGGTKAPRVSTIRYEIYNIITFLSYQNSERLMIFKNRCFYLEFKVFSVRIFNFYNILYKYLV